MRGDPGPRDEWDQHGCKAERDGDYYVLNGSKIWTTYAQWADWMFCLVRTSVEPIKQMGISFLLLDMKTPGIEIVPLPTLDGPPEGDQEINQVFFDNVRVPVSNRIGEENQGWTYAKFLLSNERTGIARIGTTKVMLAQVKQRAAATSTGRGTLLDDPLFAARLAEVENGVLALELTQLRVSKSESDGRPNPASSILKLRGSQLQQAVTELLVEVAGPDALPFDGGDAIDSPQWAQHAAPRYLNFRKTSIYGGSNEVQRTIISSTILGL